MDDWTDAQKASLVARILSGELTVKAACERHSLSPERIRDWVMTYRRSAREALDVQLSQALARQGMDADDLNAAEFSGPLTDIPVPELLQTVALGRKDAVLVVSHAGQESRIWCVGGEIVDAESGRLTGELAVYRILGIEQGQLLADFRSVQRVRVVHASTSSLLLEAARRKDEAAMLLARLGAPEMVYVPAPPALAPAQGAEPALLQVLRLFNPGCTIEQVLASSDRGDLETLQAISRLLEGGYVVADELLTQGRKTHPPAEPSTELSSISSLLAHARTGTPERSMSVAQGAALALVLVTSFALVLWAFGRHRWAASPAPALGSPSAVSPALLPVPPLVQVEALPRAQPEPTPPSVEPTPASAEPQPPTGEPQSIPTPEAAAPAPPVAAESPPAPRAPEKARRAPSRSRAARRDPVSKPLAPASAPPDPSPLDTPPLAPVIEIIPEREPQIQVLD